MALKTATLEQKRKSRESLQKWKAANPEKIREYAIRHRKPYVSGRARKIRDDNTPPAPNKPEVFCCRKCGETKPFNRTFFPPSYENKWRLGYRCRICFNEKCYRISASYRYKISKGEVDRLKSVRECKICGSTERLNIDHCHSSGKVRDVLCAKCNNGLGCFGDDVEKMKKAIAYIECHLVYPDQEV